MKQLAMALCVVMLPMQASALSLICQDKVATGANWVNGQWVQANFRGETYTLTDQVSDGEFLIDECRKEAAQMEEMWRGAPGKCFKYGDLGKEQSLTPCVVPMIDDKINFIHCSIASRWGTLRVIPDGEAVRTSHFWTPSKDTAEEARASAYIAIGACNVIAQ